MVWPACTEVQQQGDEIAIGCGVEQRAFAGEAADRGHHVPAVALDAVGARPFHHQRNEIARHRLLPARHIDEGQRGAAAVVLERDHGIDLGGGDGARLVGKPAAFSHEGRQDVVLDRLALAAREQRMPAGDPDQRGPFAAAGFRRRLRCVLVLEQEPEEAVGRKRDDVGAFADAREGAAAEHFDRHAALPRAEIDLGGLRRPRQVGDAQDRLVLVFTHVGEHGPVDRADEARACRG